MLYYLSQFLQQQAAGTPWADYLSPLRVFRYITFRSAGAAVTALLLSLWLGPKVIVWLTQLKFGQQYTDKAEEGGGLGARFLSKKGTPTMGCILIVLVLDLAALFCTQWNALILLTLLSLIVLAGLGFYDDYMKITQQNNRGTASQVKLWVQFALALFIGIYLWMLPETKKLISEVMVPFFKHPVLTGAGPAGLGLTGLTIMGSSNAGNFTHRLDGLALGCTLIFAAGFFLFPYNARKFRFAGNPPVPYVQRAGGM